MLILDMKKIIIGIILAISMSTMLLADTYVNGYYKSNGTYVQGHYRSSPNSTRSDNWSERGNTNPYTGKQGTRNSCGSLSLSC